MKVMVNEVELDLEEGLYIEELLEIRNMNKWTGVWVNEKRLLEKEYSLYRLKENDKVVLFRPLSGG